ncbi:hypothetical protein CL638_01845, partial [bacterium]|nr:hypothetical protein [bacterium]
MEINFIADSDSKDYSDAIDEYESIWSNYGEDIILAWEDLTSLKFRETNITAVVFNGISHSHPLSLRDDVSSERKKSILIHELGHRLLYGRVNQIDFSSLENHKTLFLVLYDVFEKLFGTEFADDTVAWDKKLPRDAYKLAWDWALQFDREERTEQFK